MWKAFVKEKWLIIILGLGFLLRIVLLEKVPHLGMDELWHGTFSLEIEKYGFVNYIFRIPSLTVNYIGPYINFLLLLSLETLGKNIFALRLPSVIAGIATILFTYHLMEKVYDKRTAILVSFILAVLPVHVYFSRVGNELIWIPFLVILSLYLINEYETKKEKKYIYLFAFVSGIGISFKLNFLFFLMGLTISWQILKYPNLKDLKFKDYIFSFLLILIGLYPLIKFNLYNLNSTPYFANFPITAGGDNLLNVPGNIAGGIWNLVYLYDFWSILLFGSFGYIISHMISKKTDKLLYEKIFLLLFISIFVFASTLTLNKFSFSDFIVLSPFVSIIIGRSLSVFFSFLERKKIVLSLFLLSAFIVFGYMSNYSFFYQWVSGNDPYLRVYTTCAEKGEEIAKVIHDSHISDVVVGREDGVRVVLKWQKYKNDFFNISYLEDEGVETKNRLYVISSANCFPYHERNKNYLEKFLRMAKEKDVTPKLLKEIKNEWNDILFMIYKIED
jgi:4-amino-4-deoxy-L-arabinose transferase-like glycosyltransferase